MILLTSFFLLITSVSIAKHASPPLFPDGCDASLDDSPFITLSGVKLVEEPNDQELVDGQECYKLGGLCSSDDDCPAPSESDCNNIPKDNPDIVVIPVGTDCIDGVCRNTRAWVDDLCTCFSACYYKTTFYSTLDQSCIGGRCVAAECAPCGEPINDRVCCGSGVPDNGRCLCGGAGEGCGVNPSKCSSGNFKDECCGRGTDNEGYCCASGTCNGNCAHQPRYLFVSQGSPAGIDL